jgi:lipopolysaccharide/colanic/teichoic acid biosynthesis glycosyltransferase
MKRNHVLSSSLKRVLDAAVAFSALVLLSPLLIVLAAAVRLAMGSPVLFRQERAGLRGKPFRIVKFRTMRDARDASGAPLPDAQRLTSLGKVMRSLSLDELPEFYNVLKGEMSMVGPRPLPLEYLGRYSPEQARRHEAKPGVTGWAQIHGRNAVSWTERFRLDVWYVDHRTLWLDLQILWKTVALVARRDGISEKGGVTMTEFRGVEPAKPGT